MKCYIISDNSFFLYGMAHCLKGSEITATFIHCASEEDLFHPDSGDLVLLFIRSPASRRRFLEDPRSRFCRLLVMPDIRSGGQNKQIRFPYLVNRKITADVLPGFIREAAAVPLKKEQVSCQVQRVFNYYSQNRTIREVSACTRMSLKSLYHLKRRMYDHYGISDCNAVGVLICRDMLSTASVFYGLDNKMLTCR